MGDTIAAQFIRNDLSGFTAMTSKQTLEEALCSSAISLGLKVNINYFTIPKALRGAGSPGPQLAIDNAVCR